MSRQSHPSGLTLTVLSVILGIIGVGGVILALLDQSLSGREVTLIVLGIVIGMAAAPWAWLIGYRRGERAPRDASREEKLKLIPSRDDENKRLRTLKRDIEFQIEEALGQINIAIEEQFETPRDFYGTQAKLKANEREWREILRQKRAQLTEIEEQLNIAESLSDDQWISKYIQHVVKVEK